MPEKKITPMEFQYQEIKKEVPSSILFFRLGDFYEMFGDDAKEAAEILEIALTSRNKNSENPLPMCGIPAKSYEKYLAKLTKAGKKVAIAEQVSDPSEKGIVKRKITRIVTPGTTFSEHILQEKKQNFIASFAQEKKTNICAITFAELTTGEVFVKNFSSAHDALRDAEKQNVAELLFTPEDFQEHSPALSYFSGTLSRHFLPDTPEKFLKDFFHIKTLKPFGIEKNTAAILSSALLFSFLEETQKTNISHISGISFQNDSKYMSLDQETIKNLELFYSSDGNKKNGLFSFVDKTKTAMGGRALEKSFLNPFKNKEDIEERLSKIEGLLDNKSFFQSLQKNLGEISDIERILSRISTERSTPRDFVLLKNSLFALQNILESPINEEGKNAEKWEEWKETQKKFFSGKNQA
jgi:DNA mismatch repair protein MutS